MAGVLVAFQSSRINVLSAAKRFSKSLMRLASIVFGTAAAALGFTTVSMIDLQMAAAEAAAKAAAAAASVRLSIQC